MKYRVEMQPLAGRYVVAFKDPETGDLVKTMAVNASAAAMIRGLADGTPRETLVRELAERFGVEPALIARDLGPLEEKLRSQGLFDL